MRLLHPAFTALALIVILSARGWAEQDTNCKFLNESSCESSEPNTRTRTEPVLSNEEHLRRCLADYVRREGPFVPEGRSTAKFKSRSEMTAMCNFAIKNHNYFWAQPSNPDVDANMRCCLNMGSSEKTCRDNIAAAMSAKVNLDFCYSASKVGEPPPPEWNVPAGCTAGPCMVTRGYCKYVGYLNMNSSSASTVIASMREQMTKYPNAAGHFRAVLRVCFGVR